jgi:hypothetical protein
LKRPTAIRILLALAAASASAEVIDRIAVSVGNRVITTSDLERKIRVTSFLDRREPDLSEAGKRQMAERMVEQKLIQRELETGRYDAPPAAGADADLAEFRRTHFTSEGEFRKSLADARLSETEVRDELLWQRRVSLFVSERFRAGVQVSEQEVTAYFEKNVRALAQAAHPGETVTLADYRASIEERLGAPLVVKALDDWLGEARKRTDIAVHEEAFR